MSPKLLTVSMALDNDTILKHAAQNAVGAALAPNHGTNVFNLYANGLNLSSINHVAQRLIV